MRIVIPMNVSLSRHQQQSQHNGSVDTSSDVIVIAHLTDFHYDAHYEDGSSAECTDFVCCRNISLVRAFDVSSSAHTQRTNLADFNLITKCFYPDFAIRQPKENATAKANKWGALHCDSPGIVVENICSVVADKHKVGKMQTHNDNIIQMTEYHLTCEIVSLFTFYTRISTWFITPVTSPITLNGWLRVTLCRNQLNLLRIRWNDTSPTASRS